MSPSHEHRPMTPEYMSLSVRAGYLAATADLILHGCSFAQFIGFHNWDLTAQMIIELQSAAMSLGVPEHVILTNDAIVAELLSDEENVQACIQLQAQRDEEMKRSPRVRPI